MGSVVLCFILDEKILMVPVSNALGVCSTGVKGSGAGGQYSGAHVPLKGIRGGSVLFHVIKVSGAELEEISWGFGPDLKYTVMLRDKYKQRVHVPNMTSLRIENLTQEDKGYYRGRASLTGGLESSQIFHLTVHDALPHPQILVRSRSITAGWCNITLECRAVEVTEALNVTWESKDLPRELDQRETLGPAPNSWNLTVSLPLSQPNASLTCVVSNTEDQKTPSLCSLCEGHRFTWTGHCWPPARCPRDHRGCAVDPRGWTVPVKETWEEDDGDWKRQAEQKAEREKDNISSLASQVTCHGWVSMPISPGAVTTH
ncbi:hypothetical protein HPG69_006416 [Diceros bicornis minor]|uniref:Ig-like domain-containing protein n=1 Tax=Diceros bicornis minor TaxID=77932 RepID=A0A7J7EWI8_DICBM|nr:hypothetical protein HPG69_006416 [Diceros bicornis minor]